MRVPVSKMVASWGLRIMSSMPRFSFLFVFKIDEEGAAFRIVSIPEACPDWPDELVIAQIEWRMQRRLLHLLPLLGPPFVTVKHLARPLQSQYHFP